MEQLSLILLRRTEFETIYDRMKPNNSIDVLTLLLALIGVCIPEVVALTRSLVCSIGYCVEQSDLWAKASTYQLMDTPLPMGVRRSRRPSQGFRRALGKAISESQGGSTPGKVCQTLSKYRKFGIKRFRVTAATDAFKGRVKIYIREAKAMFAHDPCRHISLATDGTRMGQKDMLYCVLYASEVGKAVWLPPQVLILLGSQPFLSVKRRSQATDFTQNGLPITAEYCRLLPITADYCRLLPITAVYYRLLVPIVKNRYHDFVLIHRCFPRFGSSLMRGLA